MCRFASFMSNVMCLLNANTNDYMVVGMNDRVDCVGFFFVSCNERCERIFQEQTKYKI